VGKISNLPKDLPKEFIPNRPILSPVGLKASPKKAGLGRDSPCGEGEGECLNIKNNRFKTEKKLPLMF